MPLEKSILEVLVPPQEELPIVIKLIPQTFVGPVTLGITLQVISAALKDSTGSMVAQQSPLTNASKLITTLSV